MKKFKFEFKVNFKYDEDTQDKIDNNLMTDEDYEYLEGLRYSAVEDIVNDMFDDFNKPENLDLFMDYLNLSTAPMINNWEIYDDFIYYCTVEMDFIAYEKINKSKNDVLEFLDSILNLDNYIYHVTDGVFGTTCYIGEGDNILNENLAMNNADLTTILNNVKSNKFREYINSYYGDDYLQASVDIAQAINSLTPRSAIAEPVKTDDDIVIKIFNKEYAINNKEYKTKRGIIHLTPTKNEYEILSMLSNNYYED